MEEREGRDGDSSTVEKAAMRVDAKARDYADTGRNRLTIVLSDRAYERLGVHAVKYKCDRSVLVDMLVCEGLKQYVVQDRGTGRQRRESAIQGGEVKDSDATLSIGETSTSSDAISVSLLPGEGEGAAQRQPPPRRKRA
jgi:hypothetical protein